MNLSELTHVWSEAPQLSDALSKFPDTVTRLNAAPAAPVGSAAPAPAILASGHGLEHRSRSVSDTPDIP